MIFACKVDHQIKVEHIIGYIKDNMTILHNIGIKIYDMVNDLENCQQHI